MSGLHKTLDYDGFGDRNCNVLGGFISVLSIKIKSDELKRGAGSAGKPFRRFCRIIQNYIAAHHKPDSKEMDYKESGTEADLCLRFPEIKEVINRYNIKSLIMTFENGDRLRIYNINLAADTPSK